MIGITVIDVILRLFKRESGAYDIVRICGLSLYPAAFPISRL
jgi:hypothetical protein